VATDQPTVWGIHAGEAGQADDLFVEQGRIALGWHKVGDVAGLEADRERFKAAVAEAYPEAKQGAIPVSGGVLFRFVHEIALDDVVLYPRKADRHVHVGRVAGAYQYDPKASDRYPHQRPVRWLGSFPRTRFSQGALHEIGSLVTLFQVRNHAEEFLAALEGRAPETAIDDDETVAIVAEEIEQTTRDFIMKTLARELKGHPFAGLVAHLLEAMGYRTRVSPEGPDAGVDILAHRDELGFEPPIIKVQVKSTEGSTGDPVVSALYGKVGPNEFGLLVTLGTFTNQAVGFAREKSNLRLIDGDQFVQLLLQHYEQLDSRYKGLLPLKRVYVPEAIQEGEAE
jgi:restriction system protein